MRSNSDSPLGNCHALQMPTSRLSRRFLIAFVALFFAFNPAEAADPPVNDLGFSDFRVIVGEKDPNASQSLLRQKTWNSKTPADQDAWSQPGDLTTTLPSVTGHPFRHVYHIVHRVNPQKREELLGVQAEDDTDTAVKVFIFRRTAGGAWGHLFTANGYTGSTYSNRGLIAYNVAYYRVFDLAYEQRSGRALLVAGMEYTGTGAGTKNFHLLRYWVIQDGVVKDKDGNIATFFGASPSDKYHAGWDVYSQSPNGGHIVSWVVLTSRPRADDILLTWACDGLELFGSLWNAPGNGTASWGSADLLDTKLSSADAIPTLLPFGVAFIGNKAMAVYAHDTTTNSADNVLRYRFLDRGNADLHWGIEWKMSRRLYEIAGDADTSRAMAPNFVTIAAEPNGNRIAVATYTRPNGSQPKPLRVYAGIWDCSSSYATDVPNGNCWVNFAGGQTSPITPRVSGVLDMYLIEGGFDAKGSSLIRRDKLYGAFPVAVSWVGEINPTAMFLYSQETPYYTSSIVFDNTGALDWALWDRARAWTKYKSIASEITGDEEVSYLAMPLPDQKRVVVGMQIRQADNSERISAAVFNKATFDNPATMDPVNTAWQFAGTVTSSFLYLAGTDDGNDWGRKFGFDINLGFPRFYSAGTDPSKATNQVLGLSTNPATSMPIQPIHIIDAAGLIRKDRDLYIRIPPGVSAHWAAAPCTSGTTTITIGGSAATPVSNPTPPPPTLPKVDNRVCAMDDPNTSLPDRTKRILKVDVLVDFTSNDDLILSGLRLENLTALSPLPIQLELDMDSPTNGAGMQVNGTDVYDEGTLRIGEQLQIQNPGQPSNAFVLQAPPGDITAQPLLKFRLNPVASGSPVKLNSLKFQLTNFQGNVTEAKLTDNAICTFTLVKPDSSTIAVAAYAASPPTSPNTFLSATLGGYALTTPGDFTLLGSLKGLGVGDGMTVSLSGVDTQAEGTYGTPPLTGIAPSQTEPGNLTYWGLVTGTVSKAHGVASYQSISVSPTPVLVNAPLTISWTRQNVSNPTHYYVSGTEFTNADPLGTCSTLPPLPLISSCSSSSATSTVSNNAVISLKGIGNINPATGLGDPADEFTATMVGSFKIAGRLAVSNPALPATQAVNALVILPPTPMPVSDLYKVQLQPTGEDFTIDSLTFNFTGGGTLGMADLNALELWKDGAQISGVTFDLTVPGKIKARKATNPLTTISTSAANLFTLRGTVSAAKIVAGNSMTIGMDADGPGNARGVSSTVPLTSSFGVTATATSKTHTVSAYTISLNGYNASKEIAVGQSLTVTWSKVNTNNPVAIEYTNGGAWTSTGCTLTSSPCTWLITTSVAASGPLQANIRIRGTEVTDGQSITAASATPFTIAGTLALANPSGPTGNTFTATPQVTNADLLKFRLTPTAESVSIAKVTLTLTPTGGFSPAVSLVDPMDPNNVKLLIDGSPVGGAPTINGTQIQFNVSFNVSTGTHDFIVRAAKVTNLALGQSVQVSVDPTAVTTPTGSVSGVNLAALGSVSGPTVSATHTVKGYTVTLTPNPSAYKIGDMVQVGWSKLPSSGDVPGDSVNVNYFVGAVNSGNCGAQPIPALPLTTTCTFTLPANATTLNAALFRMTDANAATSQGASSTFTVVGTLKLGHYADNSSQQAPNAFTTYPTVTNADLFRFRITAAGEQTDFSTLTFTWSGTGIAQSELQNLKLFRGGTQVGGVPTVSASTITFNTLSIPKGAQDFVLRGDVVNLSPIGDSLTVGLAATNFGSPTGTTSTIDLTTVVGAISGSLPDMIHTVKGYTVTMTPAQPAYKIGDAVQLNWSKVPPSGPTAPGDSVNVDYFVGATDSGDCGAHPTGASPVVTSCNFTLPNTATALNNGKFQVQDAAVSTSTGSTSTFTVTGTMTLGEHSSGQPGNAFAVLPTATNADLYRFKLTTVGEPVTLTSIIFDAAFLGIDPSDITALTLIKDGVPVSAAFAVNANNIAASLTGVTINGASSFVLRGTVANLIAGDEVTFSLNPTTDIQATGVTSSMDLTTVPGALAGSVNSMQHIAKSYMINAPAANEVLGVGQTGYVVRWTPKGGAGTTVKIYFAKDGTTFGAPIATVSGSSWTWTPSVPDAISAIARLKIEDSTNPTIFGISAPFTIAGQIIVDTPTAGNIWKAGDPHDIKWHTVGTYGTVRIEWTGEAGMPPYSAWTVLGTVPASTGSFTWTTQDADATPPTGNTKIRVVDGDTSGTHPPAQTESAVFKLARLKMISPITTVAGETFWTIGSTQNIQWDAMGLDTVQLLYATTPDFASPIQLNGGTPVAASAGTLSWTIPNTPAAQARIRIYDPVSGILTESDPFHIAATFTLLQPTAGATGQVGQPIAIAWTTDAGTVPQVLIQVSSDDFATVRPDSPGLVNNVSPLTPAWVPAAAGANTKIRICDARDAKVCVTSAPVRISGLAIESPSSGNRLVAGSPWTIRWNFDGAFSSVKIELLDQSKNVIRTITPGTSVGASGIGTYNWSGPSLTDIGQIRYLRVSDTAGSTSADSAAFSIGAPFDFISPASSVIWGVGEQRQIQWSPSVTDDPAVTKVKLEYWNGTAYVPVVATDGTTGVFNNTGSVTWSVADLPGLLGNPQAAPTQPFTLRISDATSGHVLDATHTSPQATASYYRIDWEVRSATPPSPLLSSLSVNDTSGWSVDDFSLNGQATRYYPYGTFSTIWSVKDVGGVVSQGADESWKPNIDKLGNAVTGCLSNPGLIGCQTRVVTIELLSAEAVVWKVYNEYQYDAAANAVEFTAWLERTGKLVDNSDTLIEYGKVEIFEDGVLIRTLPATTAPVILPDASGRFTFNWDLKRDDGTSVNDGKTYFTKSTIRRNGRDFTSGGALNVTIPKKILTGGTGSGGGGGSGGGITVADLTTALDPIKTATVGPASTLQQIKDGVGTIGVNQLPLVQAVNDIHAATVGDPLNANDSALDQIKNEITSTGAPGSPTLRDLVAQTHAEVTDGTTAGTLKQRVIAIMEGEGTPDGFAGLRQFGADVETREKTALERLPAGQLLNRDTAVEEGQTTTIQFRTTPGLPVLPDLKVYGPAGFLGSFPMTESSPGIYQTSVTFDTNLANPLPEGEYMVVAQVADQPALPGGALDSMAMRLTTKLAREGTVSNVITTLTDTLTSIDTRLGVYEQTMKDLQPLALATKDRAMKLMNDLSALSNDWMTDSPESLYTRLKNLADAVGTPPAGSSIYTAANAAASAAGSAASAAGTAASAAGAAETAANQARDRVGTPVGVSLAADVDNLKKALATVAGTGGVTMDSLNTRFNNLETLIAGLPAVQASDQTQQLAAINEQLTALEQDVAGIAGTGGNNLDAFSAQLNAIKAAVDALQTQGGTAQTDTLMSKLDELQKTVASAQGSSAAVGLSQSAYSAASEAVKILQELQTQLRTGGGAGNAQLLLGQLGEKLNTVSTSVTVIPGKMSAEELSTQLKELAKKASGVATEKGYHFDSLYEIAEAQSGDVKTVRNQVEELKTLLEMQRAILEQKVNQPVMKSWFEAN